MTAVTPNDTDVFVVGPVRSGTSWLHTMLAEHPDLASPPETHLFANYLGPLVETWHADQRRLERALQTERAQVGFGLATVLTDDEFTALVRSWYSSVRDLILAEKPSAHRLLEKTPDHAHWIDTVFRCVPDASVVFMVRDPRATVRSVLSASREEWGDWAPTSVEEATALWLASVRPYFSRKRDTRIMLVRYEDLRSDATELERVAKFLGLADPAQWQKTATSAAPHERPSLVLRGDAATHRLRPYDTTGFSYHDGAPTRELTRYELAYICSRCRDEMHALGYEPDAASASFRLRAEHGIRSLRHRSERLYRSIAGRVSRRG
ncbi:MAG TPA: sulfotransferase [Acidimicrobiia bacterium]|nr:sulfotransferase [Acidimicrobiia bacterium]